MGAVLVPPSQTQVICLCFTDGKVRVIGAAAIFFSALLNKGAEHTKQITRPLPVAEQGLRLHRHMRCARPESTPFLQALAGKQVVVSLLGHRRLVALSKKKCFSNDLGYTLVVLEVLQALLHCYLSIGLTKMGDNTF